jgi:hypothetical protein
LILEFDIPRRGWGLKERWRNFPNKGPLLALSAGHATVDSYAAFLAPLWPLLMVRFDLSLAAVGVLISVVGLSGAAVQPLYGFIADRSERRTFLIWGPVLAAVFTCMIGWAPTRVAFVACLIMAHVGINAYHPQAAATVSRIGGARRICTGAGDRSVVCDPVWVGADALSDSSRTGDGAVVGAFFSTPSKAGGRYGRPGASYRDTSAIRADPGRAVCDRGAASQCEYRIYEFFTDVVSRERHVAFICRITWIGASC